MKATIKTSSTSISLLCIFKRMKDVRCAGLSIPRVTAEADNSSAIEAERITIGTAIASNNSNGRVKIFFHDTLIPRNFIAS